VKAFHQGLWEAGFVEGRNVARWGPDTSSDKLRAAARCTSCGSKGATVQHPGWAGNHIGFCPFPTNISDES
jgi:hypothetical protein